MIVAGDREFMEEQDIVPDEPVGTIDKVRHVLDVGKTRLLEVRHFDRHYPRLNHAEHDGILGQRNGFIAAIRTHRQRRWCTCGRRSLRTGANSCSSCRCQGRAGSHHATSRNAHILPLALACRRNRLWPGAVNLYGQIYSSGRVHRQMLISQQKGATVDHDRPLPSSA